MASISPAVSAGRTVLDERAALWGGVAATVFIGLPIALIALNSVIGLFGQLIGFFVAVYVIGLFVQFWASQAYKDGLTTKEILLAVGWPVDIYRDVRVAVKGVAPASSAADTSRTVLDERTALWGGVAATVFIGLPFAVTGISSALDLAGQLIWLAVAGYIIGLFVHYWTLQVYKDGLTADELRLIAFWPADLVVKARRGAQILRQTSRRLPRR